MFANVPHSSHLTPGTTTSTGLFPPPCYQFFRTGTHSNIPPHYTHIHLIHKTYNPTQHTTHTIAPPRHIPSTLPTLYTHHPDTMERGVISSKLHFCPSCKPFEYILGHPTHEPGEHPKFPWAMNLACPQCRCTYTICTVCTNQRLHFTNNIKTQHHHDRKHSGKNISGNNHSSVNLSGNKRKPPPPNNNPHTGTANDSGLPHAREWWAGLSCALGNEVGCAGMLSHRITVVVRARPSANYQGGQCAAAGG